MTNKFQSVRTLTFPEFTELHYRICISRLNNISKANITKLPTISDLIWYNELDVSNIGHTAVRVQERRIIKNYSVTPTYGGLFPFFKFSLDVIFKQLLFLLIRS
jgi:hypothetical protein